MHERLANQPLLAIRRDQKLAVPTPEWDRLAAAAARGFNVLVSGGPGAGRTTALYRLAAAKLLHEPLFVPAAPAGTAGDVLALVADALGVELRPRILEELRARNSGGSLDAELIELGQMIVRQPPRTILLDDLPAGEEAHRLFGRLRDVLWQGDHQWIVATSLAGARDLARPPADAFFEVRVELKPLDEVHQRELLRLRAGTEDFEYIIDAVIDGPASPREVITLAREALLDPNVISDLRASRHLRAETLEQLTDLQRDLVDYLRHSGEAGPSDPDLHQALRVSATTLRDAFNDLAERDIVHRRTEQQVKQGRPRVVYELKAAFRT